MKIFLTGKPGIGKTTIIIKLLNLLRNNVIGFWTEELRDERTGKRLGFKVITTDGKNSILANKNFDSPFKVGSYGVNIKGFEEIIIPLLESSTEQKDKIIIIDEIGKMELFSEKFILLVKKFIFSNDYNIIATIPIKDVHPIVASLRNLKHGDLIEITEKNRDKIPDYLFNLIKNIILK